MKLHRLEDVIAEFGFHWMEVGDDSYPCGCDALTDHGPDGIIEGD